MTVKKYPRDIHWNELNSSRVTMTQPSFDLKKTSFSDAWRAKNISRYVPDILDGRTKFTGIVLRSTPSPYPYIASGAEKLYSEFTTVSEATSEDSEDSSGDKVYWRYEVMIPAINGFLQAPDSLLSVLRTETDAPPAHSKNWNQQTINYYTTATPSPGLWGDGDGDLEPGTFVDIIFENTKIGVIPRIVRTNKTKIQFASYKSARVAFTRPHDGVAARPIAGSCTKTKTGTYKNKTVDVLIPARIGRVVGSLYDPYRCDEYGNKGKKFAPSSVKRKYDDTGGHYPPGSQKMIDLLKRALIAASLPQGWAEWQETHNLLHYESGGIVGVPNYTFNEIRDNIKEHPEEWKRGVWPLLKKGQGPSENPSQTASGLGQLKAGNVLSFYPYGYDGIGDALSEAIGFVKYVEDRYGDPRIAWAVYGQGGKDKKYPTVYFEYKGDPNKVKSKKFHEGY